MASPELGPAVPPTNHNYPPQVVKLREYANSISKKAAELECKPESTFGQISGHALSITDSVESACAGRRNQVLEPFAAVAVDEIGRLLSSCCADLTYLEKKPRKRDRLEIWASRPFSRSRPSSPSPAQTNTSLDDYLASLKAVKALLRLKIENGQSQLVYSGTSTPVAVQHPALLQNEISTSTVIDQAFKTALQTMANMTDGLPFPYKAVAQTVLQFHQHLESYRQIDGSISALISKIDDFVKVLTRPGGRKINSGDEAAEAIETFFRAVQSILVRLEILRATRPVKGFAAPGAVSAAVTDAEANLDHALKLLNTSLQLSIHNTVHDIRDAQILRKSDVNYSSVLQANPKRLHGRYEELSRLVAFVLDRSRSIRLAIMGAGGLGKTTLAQALVQHAKVVETFRHHRFLVTVEAASGVDDLLTGMLTTFGLAATSNPLESLLQHFRSSHHQTLLVIDNLETIWNAANAEQRSKTERVLVQLDAVEALTLVITCRGADLPPDIEWANRDAVVLSTLSPEAALATFTDIAGEVDPSDEPVRDALLREVDYMPLAVTLLARLVARGKQLRDLHRRWNSVHTSMLRTQPNGRLDNVDTSVQLSIAYLPPDDLAPLQLLSLCAQLPDGMRLPVRTELERLCGFRDLEGALDVIQGLALVYVTRDEDETIRILSPIRLYVLANHKPQGDHRTSLLRVFYDIAKQAPRRINSHFPAARARILPELSNLDALLLSEIQHLDASSEPASTDLIDAVTAVSSFSRYDVPNERLLRALMTHIEHLPGHLASSLEILADIHRMRGAYDLALEAATRARSLYQSTGQRSDVADCDWQLAIIHRLKGDYPEAIASLSAAREYFYELDSQFNVAYCDRSLGIVAYQQEDYDGAAALTTSAREVFLRLDEPGPAAFCQQLLGDIHRIRGEYDAAQKLLESALQTHKSLGSMADIASCNCLLGDVYRCQHRLSDALECLQVAYDISQSQGDVLGIAGALRQMSYVRWDQGDFAQARRLLLDAQRLYESIGNARDTELCVASLAELATDEKMQNT